MDVNAAPMMMLAVATLHILERGVTDSPTLNDAYVPKAQATNTLNGTPTNCTLTCGLNIEAVRPNQVRGSFILGRPGSGMRG